MDAMAMANLPACRAGLLALATCALVGCQTGGNTELLERQLRIQEDRIYDLEDELQRHCKMLQACRKENQALKVGSTSPSNTSSDSTNPASSIVTPKSTAPSPSPSELTPPKLELDLPPVPPPTSSSGTETLPLGPDLNAAASKESPSASDLDGSTLEIRVPQVDQTPLSAPDRMVDQSGGSGVKQQAHAEPVERSEPIRQAERPAARRPQWSPYR
jgi:hypothetical protein